MNMIKPFFFLLQLIGFFTIILGDQDITTFCSKEILEQHKNHTKTSNKRTLFVVTCTFRQHQYYDDAIFFHGADSLMMQGAFVSNPCLGQKYLTKVKAYSIVSNFLLSIHNHQDIHVLYLDREVYWGTNSLQELWLAYDCARNGKDLLIPTESTCWVGRPCNEADFKQFYPNLTYPSITPYIKSGVIMGKLTNVAELIRYYFRSLPNYYKEIAFNEPLALTTYLLEVIPGQYALDYHHLFSTNALIFESKSYIQREGVISTPCIDYKRKRINFYCHAIVTNLTLTDDCLLQRPMKLNQMMPLEVNSLATRSMVWHFGGIESKSFLKYIYQASDCMKQIHNLNNL